MGIRGARTGSLCVAFVAALTLVSACSGDAQEPSQLDESKQNGDSEPRTPPEKSDPEPTPDGADEPDQSDHEQELYDATVTFYDTINEAYLDLDPAPIKTLVADGSESAVSGYVDTINNVKSRGNHFADLGKYKVADFDYKEDADPKSATVTFTLSINGGREVDENGKEYQSFEPDSWEARITFGKQGERWLVLTQDLE